MSRPYKPAQYPALSPYLTVADPAQTLAFYQDAFQFKLTEDPMMQKDQMVHVQMTSADGQALIMFGLQGAWGSTKQSPKVSQTEVPMSLYLYVPDVDAFAAHAGQHQAKVIAPPEDMFWGDRMCLIEDIDGYHWNFATNIEDFDPSKIPS